MAGKKGRSGRKSKSFEFEINRLKELSIKRAIKILEAKEPEFKDEKIALTGRQDQVTLKVIDKTLSQEITLKGDDEAPVRIIFRAAADSAKPETR